MKDRKLVIGLAIVAMFALSIFIFIMRGTGESDEQIKEKLRCDRNTLEVLGTDYYCDNIEAYRQDLKQGKLLDQNWTKAQEQLRARGL